MLHLGISIACMEYCWILQPPLTQIAGTNSWVHSRPSVHELELLGNKELPQI